MWACNSDTYNYCHDQDLCESYFGSVRCRCNLSTSKDVSPQANEFPGEICSSVCSLKKCNGGSCFLENNMEKCFCSDGLIGDDCVINVPRNIFYVYPKLNFFFNFEYKSFWNRFIEHLFGFNSFGSFGRILLAFSFKKVRISSDKHFLFFKHVTYFILKLEYV